MAKFSKIPEAQAPRPIRQSGRLAQRMRQYEEHIGAIKSGEVGRLVPEGGETARGIALRVARAARRMNKSADTWMVDGNVYFRIS
jgi:hypothetical protein